MCHLSSKVSLNISTCWNFKWRKAADKKIKFLCEFLHKIFQQTFGFENQTQLVLCMRKWDGKQYQDKGKEPVWRGDRAVFILQSYNPTTV